MRDGRPLKNQTCEQGDASSMCPRRSRRTFDSVTSTPHLSQMTPRCFIRLYFPHRHSQSVTGPKMRAQKDRKSTRLNSSHQIISYAVFCLKKKKISCTHTSVTKHMR